MGLEMSRFPVSPAKEDALIERMRRVGVRPDDIVERFTRSSGAGGQHVNKVSTCVVLLHRPTGLMVKCQSERSQGLNRFVARRRLIEKIESQRLGVLAAERQRIEKIRRQKRRRSRRAKARMLADKRHQAEKKAVRGPVQWEG